MRKAIHWVRRQAFSSENPNLLELALGLLYNHFSWSLYPLASAPGRLLDVGCRNGEYLNNARDMGWKVMGTEINPKIAKSITSATGIEVFGETLDKLPEDVGQFDVITMWMSLNRELSPLQSLIRVRKLLREGGEFFVTVPNLASVERAFFGKAWAYFDVPRALFFFNEQTLSDLFQKAGFQKPTITHKFYPWATWRSLANKLAGRPQPVSPLMDTLGTLFAFSPSALTSLLGSSSLLLAHVTV